MTPFDELGFQWDRSSVPARVPRSSLERAIFRFRRMLPEYVWDAGALEGNPFTFPEVKTLLEGVTVGGRRLSDQEQILNLAESSKRLLFFRRTSAVFLRWKQADISLHDERSPHVGGYRRYQRPCCTRAGIQFEDG